MRKILLLLILALAVAHCAAPSTPADPEARARQVGLQLRCPICRGVSIADSPSELSQEMMAVVRQQIAEGKSDQEILKYFEDRYGPWILLKPKAEGVTLAVWLLPLAFVVVGGGIIVVGARRMKSHQHEETST